MNNNCDCIYLDPTDYEIAECFFESKLTAKKPIYPDRNQRGRATMIELKRIKIIHRGGTYLIDIEHPQCWRGRDGYSYTLRTSDRIPVRRKNKEGQFVRWSPGKGKLSNKAAIESAIQYLTATREVRSSL